jgi:hypothetical protein
MSEEQSLKEFTRTKLSSIHDCKYANLREKLGLIMGMLLGVTKFLFTFDLVEKEEQCPF